MSRRASAYTTFQSLNSNAALYTRLTVCFRCTRKYGHLSFRPSLKCTVTRSQGLPYSLLTYSLLEMKLHLLFQTESVNNSCRRSVANDEYVEFNLCDLADPTPYNTGREISMASIGGRFGRCLTVNGTRRQQSERSTRGESSPLQTSDDELMEVHGICVVSRAGRQLPHADRRRLKGQMSASPSRLDVQYPHHERARAAIPFRASPHALLLTSTVTNPARRAHGWQLLLSAIKTPWPAGQSRPICGRDEQCPGCTALTYSHRDF